MMRRNMRALDDLPGARFARHKNDIPCRPSALSSRRPDFGVGRSPMRLAQYRFNGNHNDGIFGARTCRLIAV
jgi:hypothetical protein